MTGTAAGETPVPARRHDKLLRRLSILLIAGVLIAAFIVPLVNINRYHRTIADTIARSLGRPVHIGSVRLQLLPRPGLAINDFTVEENGDFGAEPMLRAPSVTVSLRLSSLWRRRLEVSRIDLDQASVNLVRDGQGQWNFGTLIDQASHTSTAPTAQRHSGASPRFPYIEFTGARINFKSGVEKTGFSFFNSDFSIWLESANEWRLRFEAQPVRTDRSLITEDTGRIRVDGALQRAASLDQTPVKLHAEWNHAELGQASQMLFGFDAGWRGDLRADADLTGTLADIALKTHLRIGDAHQQEFTPMNSFDIDARCQAGYHHATHALDGLTCLWPVDGGHLLLTGSVPDIPARKAQLTLEINQVPASFAVNVLGLLRSELPQDLTAKGTIAGSFHYEMGSQDVPAPRLTGDATVEPLEVSFAGDGTPFEFDSLHFIAAGRSLPAAPAKSSGRKKTASAPAIVQQPQAILLAPANLDAGGPAPLTISGAITHSGFSFHLAGAAKVERLRQLSGAFGSLHGIAGHLAPAGTANLDLTFARPWVGEPLMAADGSLLPRYADVNGWMRLENAQAALPWLGDPLAVTAATVNFDDTGMHWANVAAALHGVALRGSLDAVLHCEAVCPARLSLDIPTLDAATVQTVLTGSGHPSALVRAVLSAVEPKQNWPALEGQVHIGTYTLGTLALHDLRAQMAVDAHGWTIPSLDASALNGSLHASGEIDGSHGAPRYDLKTTWSGISAAQLGPLFAEKWPATGSLDGGAELTLSGYSAGDLASSAKGKFHWQWNRGSLTAPAGKTAPGALAPVGFAQWNATGTIGDAALTLASPAGAEPGTVTGKIGFDRGLSLAWPQGQIVGGTLAKPLVTAKP